MRIQSKYVLTLASVLMLRAGSLLAQNKPEGLFINSKAPDFRLKDQSGAEVSLKELRKKGPVVIMFYKGSWDPYCTRALKRFQDSITFITDKGAQLVVMTPEGSEAIAKTQEKTGAVYPILHDEEMKLSKAYAVAYEVDERTLSRQKSFGNDLLQVNNQKGKAWLPIPAVYVVNRDGAVTYRYFTDDNRQRAWVKDVIREIK